MLSFVCRRMVIIPRGQVRKKVQTRVKFQRDEKA